MKRLKVKNLLKEVEKNPEILFVNLQFAESQYLQSPQLGLLYVATNLSKHGFTVRVIDHPSVGAEELIDFIREISPQILGFHVNTDSLPRVRRAIQLLKKKNLQPPLIIFGGPHVTIDDQSLLKENYGQIIVRGEGEETAVDIAKWWIRGIGKLEMIKGITYRTNQGNILSNANREYTKNLDNILPPDYSLLIGSYKGKALQIITGRGCPYQCAFCAEGLLGIEYRFHTTQYVLDAIDSMMDTVSYGYLGILDDTFLVDRHRVEEIARGLILKYGPERLIWFCEGRVDFINKNPDLFPLLRQAGLARIQIGIESGSQDVLDSYRKGTTIEEIENAVRILAEAGIPSIYGNFIIGGAFETKETVESSINLAKRLIQIAPGRMEIAASILGIYPGTAIAKNPHEFGLEIVDYEMNTCISLQHPVAVTKNMGIKEILDAFHRFNAEVLQEYETHLPNISNSLIMEHLKLKRFGATTRWADLYLRFQGLKNYYDLNLQGAKKFDQIPYDELFEYVPRRTAPVIAVENNRYAIKDYPQQVTLNQIGGEIFVLCSGKLSVQEIIDLLYKKTDFLPPYPDFEKQVIEFLVELSKGFLIVFYRL